MELGGNIELQGFEADPNELTIIKKIVGNFIKEMSEEYPGVERLLLENEPGARMLGTLTIDGSDLTAEAEDPNLFFALDTVLKDLRADAAQA